MPQEVNIREEKKQTLPFDRSLLNILACPLTKGPLTYDDELQELISEKAHLAYPIREGIPFLIPEEARRIEQ